MRSLLARKVYLAAVGIIVVLALAGLIAGLGAVSTVLLGLILLAFVTAWAVVADRRVSAGGSRTRQAAMADETDALPSTPFIEDDASPLGATSEQHEEIIPQDLPRGHPGRAAAEAQAAESVAHGGEPLTRGDVHDRPQAVRDDDLHTDRKEGGEGRFRRDDVEWTAEDQGRGEVRGERSSR